MVIKLVEIVNSRLDYKTTNSNGDLTLACPNKVNSNTLFQVREGTTDLGTGVTTVTVQPLILSKINLLGDDEVVKGDKLLLTAQIVPNTRGVDLSGYSLVFSGAISGTYVTDSKGQVNLYYTGQGTGDKTLNVTAGNYNASKTFQDILIYWNTLQSKYPEQYTLNQGFSKLTQYYSLTNTVNNMGIVCIGDYGTIGNWELTFRVITKVTDINFDIFTWSGNPESLNNLTTTRTVSFNVNDIVTARCLDGTLTVTKNNESLFTKQVTPNQFPGLLVTSTLPTSINISSNTGNTVKTLNFNELNLKEL